MTNKTNQQEAHGCTRRQAILDVAVAFGGLSLCSAPALAAADEEVSHTAESIHQETVIKASCKRVYEALTDTKQFDKIIQLSGESMPASGKPTEINRDAGGAFALFGGYITGRHIELLPNERIVQAWRVGSWPAGVYSIAKFELVEQASTTKIVFDHTGFPKGLGEHLASGWKAHYWEPLKKLLAYNIYRPTNMNAKDFHRIALSMEGAEQGSHMGAVDFRVGGRIFATLAALKQGYGNLMITPEQQAAFVAELPEVFIAIAGAWGRMGATHIRLAVASEEVLAGALRVAWKLRVEKNVKSGKKPTAKVKSKRPATPLRKKH